MTSTDILRRSLLTLLAACTLTARVGLIAQSPAPSQAAAAAHSTVPALFLSDIHLDPFSDPAKVAKLNASAAADWPAILSAPASPTQAKDFAALQEACPTHGIDTPYVLWQSSLTAIHGDASQARFVTVSGDLLAHSFDCKFENLLPAAKSSDYPRPESCPKVTACQWIGDSWPAVFSNIRSSTPLTRSRRGITP